MHICCASNWISVFENLMWKIRDSGLYEYVDKIRCCILGDYSEHSYLFHDPKMEILSHHPDIRLFEPFTLNRLYIDAYTDPEPFHVFYLHTKGIRHGGTNPNVIDWINYLCYFNIYHFRTCVKYLKSGFDTVGVDMIEANASHYANKPVLHYSGNFWWATSEHIKKNGPCIYRIYQSPEFWITEKRIGRHACLWIANIENHYKEAYPREKYENKDFNLSVCERNQYDDMKRNTHK